MRTTPAGECFARRGPRHRQIQPDQRIPWQRGRRCAADEDTPSGLLANYSASRCWRDPAAANSVCCCLTAKARRNRWRSSIGCSRASRSLISSTDRKCSPRPWPASASGPRERFDSGGAAAEGLGGARRRPNAPPAPPPGDFNPTSIAPSSARARLEMALRAAIRDRRIGLRVPAQDVTFAPAWSTAWKC